MDIPLKYAIPFLILCAVVPFSYRPASHPPAEQQAATNRPTAADAAMAKAAGTTPESYVAMRENFERSGVSGEGFDRLIGGISRQTGRTIPR
jgi:hypothetical protein